MMPHAHQSRDREPARPVRHGVVRPLPAAEQTDAATPTEAAAQLEKFDAVLGECSQPATFRAIEKLLERMRSRVIP